MDIKQKPLLKIAIAISALWVAAQIALIACFWGRPQYNDMAQYISMARRCFAGGEWYPMAEDVYSRYIWAPGFINWLILQLRIFGTINLGFIPLTPQDFSTYNIEGGAFSPVLSYRHNRLK